MSTDVLIYAGGVSVAGYELTCTKIAEKKKSERALLVLATPGGDPHAGFRIARALQHVYEGFDVLVPRYCKSAGTLIALGAETLYLDDMSELGPLDIQVKKNDEVVGRNSGLDIIQAVNYLQNQTLSAFQTYLVGLTQDMGLSTKVASDISSRLTTGLFEPITAQIDPVRLAEMQRATEVAFEYGTRLAEKSKNLRPDGLQKLVNGYPSHGFVIDRKEAKTLFFKVVKPSGVLQQFSEAIRTATEESINARVPKIDLITVDFDLKGAANENEHTPDPSTGSTGASTSEPEVGGNIPAHEATPVEQQHSAPVGAVNEPEQQNS